jgi:hypothetical protein
MFALQNGDMERSEGLFGIRMHDERPAMCMASDRRIGVVAAAAVAGIFRRAEDAEADG